MVSDPCPVTIEEALEQFLLQLEADGRSDHTIRQYRRHVLALARWLASTGEGTRLTALGPQVVARFMVSPAARTRPDGKPKRATAVNALRSSIRCFSGYLHAAGLVPVNPAALLRRALCSPTPSRALTEEEVERFLAVLEKGADERARRNRVLFTLMLRTGIRIGSALGLDVEDTDLERGELLLRGAKGNRVERVFMSERVSEMVRGHIWNVISGPVFRNGGGRRLTVRHANRVLQGHLERAGIHRVRGSHVFRHTFACNLYSRTGDIVLVNEALTHRSLASTVHYLRNSKLHWLE